MSTPRPLSKTDAVAYLVKRKHPFSALSAIDKRHARKGGIPLADFEIFKAADSYRLQLENLPAEQLEELVARAVEDDARVQHARQELEEQQRSFNKPFAKADFRYWASASYWTPDEAVALSLDRDPRHVKWKTVEPFVAISKFAKTFADRRELARRAVVMGQLFELSVPTFFLAWAERVHLEVPKEMNEEIETLGLQIGDWKTIADQREGIIKLLEEQLSLVDRRNSELENTIAQINNAASGTSERVSTALAEKDKKIAELELRVEGKSNPSATSRERQSLLRLVIGMAIKGYAYNPKASRTKTAQEIASDLQLLGLSLDEDTVRKYLNEAKDVLPGDMPE